MAKKSNNKKSFEQRIVDSLKKKGLNMLQIMAEIKEYRWQTENPLVNHGQLNDF